MLDIERLRVEYPMETGTHLAVKEVSVSVQAGEFFTLLGPSGCGKTTTLRSVAGLETPTAGAIRIDGRPVFDSGAGVHLPTHKRDISMVFQSYAIWPHMSVFQNVVFPLEAKGQSRAQGRQRVIDVLAMVGLSDYVDRPATQLSGGQQQRVALARAIVKDAKVLLLDEPLSNLDAKLREQMRHELRDLQRRVGTTTIYVTHDQDEALSLSDRIAVMNLGDVIELGTPIELYLRPRHPFTARFIGQADLMPCTVVSQDGVGVTVDTALGPIVAAVHTDLADVASHLLIRPEHAVLLGDGDAPEVNVFDGTINHVIFSGKTIEYKVAVANQTLTVLDSSTVLRASGQPVRVHFPPERCVLLSER